MSGRGKSKSHAFPSDFIALGAKKPGAQDHKRESPATNQSSGSGSSGSGGGLLNKKKTSHIGATARKPVPLPGQDKSQIWETIALEVDTCDLQTAVLDAEEEGEGERVEGLLCGAVKALRKERAKPDQVTYLSLLFLVKQNPGMFVASEFVREAFCSLLKRDVRESYKSKGNSLVSICAAGILMSAYQDERHWPELFVRVFVDDAMGERVWVDHPECKMFVDNIITAFNTRLPPKAATEGGACPSPPTGNSSGNRTPTRADDEVQIIELPINNDPMEEGGNSGVISRYAGMQEFIESTVMNIVREQLNRRQGTENITRNFIKFLTSACGLPEIRLLVVSKLEMWLMNPKVSRPAQDLLQAVALNCCTHSVMDTEVIVHLTKLRLKNKPNITFFLSCIKDLCKAHSENLPTILKHTIFNELSNARNTNNMNMLSIMFQADPDKAAAALASVFLELLMQKDCYLRALRALLREIIRCLRHDINLPAFCFSLMMDKLREKFDNFKEFEFKERIFTSLVDLITLAVFLGISPPVREGLNAFSRGDKKDLSAYKAYLKSISIIMRDAMWWMHEVVPKLYKPEGSTYTSQLYKLLFMAPSHEEYFKIDNWPVEADRALFFKLTSEIPVQQETVLRIFLIGLQKNLPLNGQDCLTLAETIIKRAASLHPLAGPEFQILYSNKSKEFMDCVWGLTAYTYPESITLPPDYQPPQMAITASYWKTWQLLLIMTAHNPEEYGSVGWESYPTLRAIMEMCITNQFVFPPPTLAASSEKLEEVRTQEVQVASQEKQRILEFESQLAAASSKQTITEQSSLLLSTITSMDPHGPLRRPPSAVLEQLKQINSLYKLGHLLCRSRQPDFLLDILQRQGTNQAMPWLADLVESSEGSFSVLPVQCLCEFLLNDALAGNDEDLIPGTVKKRKAGELLHHLQQLLRNPSSDHANCMETLDYFMRRLGSMQTPTRLQAIAGLKMLLTPSDDHDMETDDDNAWLLQHLPSLPCFPQLYHGLALALRQACQVENDPNTVSLYIRFLSQTCQSIDFTSMDALALDMATVIVERSSLLPAILPGSTHPAATHPTTQLETYNALLFVFHRFMLLVRQSDNEFGWSESQDLINVHWASEETATLHILVVHAQIILLTYGMAPPSDPLFHQLLQMWFPPDEDLPRAYLVDTSEEALLIPDWLKLKMIRSAVPVLVDSALKDLEPHQLVLFIQSFGIPVASMSKLLQTLDQAVQADLEAVANSVLDKTYMGQLVAVQHNRGATGGKVFADTLGLSLDLGGPISKNNSEKHKLPPLVIPPRSTAMIPPNQVKSTILHLYDVGSPSRMNYKEKQDTFRTLQKFLASEIASNSPMKPMLDATVSAIHSILQSDLGSGFVSALTQRTSFSCSLFRLISLALSKPALSTSSAALTLLKVSKNLLKQFKANSVSTPLTGLLEQYIAKLEPAQSKPTVNCEKSTLDLSSSNVEKEIQSLAVEALQRGSTAELVSSMTTLLLNQRDKEHEHEVYMSQSGLLVDWLELLDPSVIATCPDLQHQLVFGRASRRQGSGPTKTVRSSRPYLLSLLTHQSSWDSLRKTVDAVLSRCQADLEPAAVLDFLTACIHIPRLWQGRDQRPPKHDKPPDVLALSGSSLEALADYVIIEGVESGDEGKETVRKRMPLVMRCAGSDAVKTATLVDHLIHLQEVQDTDKPKADMAKHLLLQVYMKIPGCLDGRLDSCPMSSGVTTSESIMDTMSHTLLSALSATQAGRQWGVKMQDFELCARKMAAAHPVLFLRNLPLMASSLQGRTQYDFSIFRSRNHLTLFNTTLGLLELLRPTILGHQYAASLELALGCYADMCSAYFGRRESFYGTIDRFVQFLNSWQEVGGPPAGRAANFLRKHCEVLMNLASANFTSRMDSLRLLMSSVSLHGQPRDTSEEGSVETPPASRSSYTDTPDTVVGNLLTDLATADTHDKMVATLQYLSEAAVPRPAILTHFQDELVYNMTHPVSAVRAIAYICILKHLRHNPNAWPGVVPSYIAAIESGDQGVVETALGHLAEMVVLGQERASNILVAVFQLGVYSNLNTAPHITDAISMLNMQMGN